MRALFVRELDVMMRRPAFMAAVCAHIGLLAAFVIAWGDGRGIPVLPDRNFYEQLRIVQMALLAVLLPWAGARSVAAERGDDLVWLSVVTALTPSRVILARAASTLIALMLLVTVGLPVVLLAKQVAGTALPRVVGDELAMQALAVVSCGTVLVARHLVLGRLAGWLAASASTVALLALARTAISSGAVAATALATIGALAALLLAVRANTSLRYLRELGT